jgi:diguanylate cyclase (GGDEF)-like protein
MEEGGMRPSMAGTLRNLKIQQQILLVTAPLLLVLLCTLGLFTYTYSLAMRSGRVALRAEESVARAEELLRDLFEMYMSVRNFVLLPSSRSPLAYETAVSALYEDIGHLFDLQADDPAQLKQVHNIQLEITRMQTEWVAPLLSQAKLDETVYPTATLQDGQARLGAIREQILRLLDEDKAESRSAVQESERVMRRMLILGIGAAILLIMVSVLAAQLVTRLIVHPLMQLVGASERAGRGDFDPALLPQLDNEFGTLSRSFAHMTEALRHEREDVASLNRFLEASTQCTSEAEVYKHLLHALNTRFNPRQIIVFKLHAEENFLEAVASQAPLPSDSANFSIIQEPESCKAVRTGRYFVVNDVSAEPLCSSKFALPKEGSYYCGPLIAGGIIIGAVRLETVKNYWMTARLALLESYLSGAASALSNLRLLESMKHRANVDLLTGLYNRRFLQDYARKLLAMARRRQQPIGVIMIDLDRFKDFNDLYGHEMGDRILVEFAKTIVSAMRETNLAARFGGDEFVVLLPDTGPEACLLVAERLRQAVMRMQVSLGSEEPLPQVTVSLGVAVFPNQGNSLEEVLRASDKALYMSKRAGRNRTTLYSFEAEGTEKSGIVTTD